MPWKHFVATMPSASAVNTTWLDWVGANVSHSITGAPSGSWNLLQVVPMSPVNSNGNGSVLCYFISGSY